MVPKWKRDKEQGFTMIEALFVLSMFLLMMSLSFLLLKPHYFQQERQSFIPQFKADLLYAQQYAITNQKVVRVNFMPSQYFYYIRKQNGEILIRRDYSNNVDVIPGSQKTTFYFYSNGNISTIGALYFYIGDDDAYQFMFQLGRGRFYVKKM
ncbi:competence type IV pilus minor pilin ComGD [Robertmurraya massiliosenegalensis]|uniref:competence type IV pilus minor pilin ComGD n=1 Tax=Robertmurraya massiliosenegalensis TaxID=1287657 RepID=UPI00031559D1|nr:competence type IV pilus minor pilin ComGD [Robertmurraya massiliosenegalensis]